MNNKEKYICPECDEIFVEDDPRIGSELFCPECKVRLERKSLSFESL
jgi:DNA-directed RNA polymerase subunit RPC12/RpoP